MERVRAQQEQRAADDRRVLQILQKTRLAARSPLPFFSNNTKNGKGGKKRKEKKERDRSQARGFVAQYLKNAPTSSAARCSYAARGHVHVAEEIGKLARCHRTQLALKRTRQLVQ